MLRTTATDLTLRELTGADAATYYDLLDRNRAHLGRHGDYQDEVHATPAWVDGQLAQPAPDRFGVWLGGQLIGRVDLVHVAPPRFGFGYWLSHDATGHGYATMACAAVVEHARSARDATDIFAGVTHGNDRSVAVLRRLGFRPAAEFAGYTRYRLSLTGAGRAA